MARLYCTNHYICAVFLPLALSLGVDPVLFRIFTVIICDIGFLTPPIGVNLFVGGKIAKVSVEDMSVAVLPLLIPYVTIVLMLALFSGWVLWLPDLIFGVSR